jgi:hypothetical protein
VGSKMCVVTVSRMLSVECFNVASGLESLLVLEGLCGLTWKLALRGGALWSALEACSSWRGFVWAWCGLLSVLSMVLTWGFCVNELVLVLGSLAV